MLGGPCSRKFDLQYAAVPLSVACSYRMTVAFGPEPVTAGRGDDVTE